MNQGRRAFCSLQNVPWRPHMLPGTTKGKPLRNHEGAQSTGRWTCAFQNLLEIGLRHPRLRASGSRQSGPCPNLYPAPLPSLATNSSRRCSRGGDTQIHPFPRYLEKKIKKEISALSMWVFSFVSINSRERLVSVEPWTCLQRASG